MNNFSELRYDSAYTMGYPQDDNVGVYADCFTVESAKGDYELRFSGIADECGQRMLVDVKDAGQDGRLLGEWREATDDGLTIFEGDVEFMREPDGRLYGYWSTRKPESEVVEDAGVWVLVPRLGSTALSE